MSTGSSLKVSASPTLGVTGAVAAEAVALLELGAAALGAAADAAALGDAAVPAGEAGVRVGPAGVEPDIEVPSGFTGVSESPPEAGAALGALAAGLCRIDAHVSACLPALSDGRRPLPHNTLQILAGKARGHIK